MVEKNKRLAPRQLSRVQIADAGPRAAAPKVKVLFEQEYLPALQAAFQRAKTSLNVLQYNFFTESGSTSELADTLIHQRQQVPDLKARVLLEGDHGDAAARNQKTVERFKDTGIETILDSDRLVTHAKGISIDGQELFAGSHNLTNTSVTKNNEVTLQVRSKPLTEGFNRYFDALVATPDQLTRLEIKDGPITLITDDAYLTHLLEMIRSAQRSLDISMYAFPALGLSGKPNPMAAQVLDELKQAAQRGCKVRMYLEQSDAFRPDITDANIAVAQSLKDVDNFEVRFDPAGKITHSKFIVRDREEVLLGSTNWTDSDFNKRHQVNWRVAMPTVARRVSKWFQLKFETESQAPIRQLATDGFDPH